MLKVVEPTYLRMVRDRLVSGGLTSGSVADLPMGMTGLFEESLKSGSLQERRVWMRVLLVFALLKEGMSAADMAILLGVNKETILGVVERFPSWFNSPDPGQFVLYHQRLSAFLLAVQDKAEVLWVSERLAALDGEKVEALRSYGLRHGLRHAAEAIVLGGDGLESLKALLADDSEWNDRCDHLGSVDEMVDGLRALAGLAVHLQDVRLLTEAVRRTVWIGNFFNRRIESALSGDEVPRDELAAFFSSRRSMDDRLHLLGCVTLMLEPERDEDILAPLWEQVAEKLEEEFAEVQEFWPPWVLVELEEKWGHLEPLLAALDEVDAEAYEDAPDDADPLLDEVVEYNFLTEDLTKVPLDIRTGLEFAIEALTGGGLSPALFDDLAGGISMGNLFLRDELLVRVTDRVMEEGWEGDALRPWLGWLLSESAFEVGPHADALRPHSFDLLRKFMQSAERSDVLWAEEQIKDWRFDRFSRRKVQLLISQWWRRNGERKRALHALSHFRSPGEKDNRSTWMHKWLQSNLSRRMVHFEAFLNFNPGQLAAELLFENSLRTGLEKDYIRAESALDWADAVARAEYLTEWALTLHHRDSIRAKIWLERAWQLARDEEDWAMTIVQLEVFSAALTVMDAPWVEGNWKTLRKTLRSMEDEELIEPTVEEFLMEGVPEAYVKFERFSRCRNRLILEASHPAILRFFKKHYPDAWEAAEARHRYLKAFEERVSELGSIRAWWREFKPWFLADGPGAADRWVWERILAYPHLFERFTAEDVRCLNVVSRKVWMRFPAERAADFHPKVEQYLERFHVDNWQIGTTWGFEGMGRYRAQLDKEDMGNVLQGALDTPWESALDWTEEKHWAGAAFAFSECAQMRDEMEQLLQLLDLRAHLIELETT